MGPTSLRVLAEQLRAGKLTTPRDQEHAARILDGTAAQMESWEKERAELLAQLAVYDPPGTDPEKRESDA